MSKNQYYKKQDYLFAMEKLKNTCKLPSIEVDFHPIQKNGSQFEQIVPVFNNDKNHFTPCFIIKTDKSFFQGSLSFQKLKFEERVRNSYQKNLPNPLSLAQPSSNYCQICQSHFEEYMGHINNQEHQMTNRKTKANQMISQLCQQYKNSVKKTKTIKKDTRKIHQIQEAENKRILRSCRKKTNIQELNVKNFSYITTKINTSHINAL